jgi:hypothetical protein
MISPTETGMITAVFKNPKDQEDNIFSRAEISGRPFTRQVENQVAVPPHQTKSIQLNVDANDVDLMFFIFVKMSVRPNALHRAQEGVCGIMVVDVLGLTGVQLSAIALSLSFLGMAMGFGLWQHTRTDADRTILRLMQALGLVVLLTLLAGALGLWILGMALSAITILLMIISVRFVIA